MASFLTKGVGLALCLALCAAGANAQDPEGWFEFTNINPNISPNDPAVPKTVHFHFRQMTRPVLNLNNSATAYEIHYGDGTIEPRAYEFDTVAQQLSLLHEGQIGSHTYNAPGLYRVRIVPTVFQGTVHEAMHYILIGPPQANLTPTLTATVTSGPAPLTTTVTLDGMPAGFDPITIRQRDSVYTFSPEQLSHTVTFGEEGLYSFVFEGRGTGVGNQFEAFQLSPLQIAVGVDTANQPTLGAVTELESLNTQGFEWNGRISGDSQRLYYLSTDTGPATVMMAERADQGAQPYFDTPVRLEGEWNAGRNGGEIMAFTITPDEEKLFLLTDFFGPSQLRLTWAEREGNATDGSPLFGTPKTIATNQRLDNSNNGHHPFLHYRDGNLALYLRSGSPFSQLWHFDAVADQAGVYVSGIVPYEVPHDIQANYQSASGQIRVWNDASLTLFVANTEMAPEESLYEHYTPNEVALRFDARNAHGIPENLQSHQVAPDGSFAILGTPRAYNHSARSISGLYIVSITPPAPINLKSELTGEVRNHLLEPNSPLRIYQHLQDRNRDNTRDAADMVAP